MDTNLEIARDLVERCKANDRQAQLDLYRQYCEGMFCVAMRFVRERDDAEDLVQEAFIKAFRKIGQFRGEVTFGAWLKRIVVNKCLDFLKARRERIISIEEHNLQIAEEPDWTVEQEVSVEGVLGAIERLPEKYREVLQLYLLEGYDHQEIADILGLTAVASRTRLMRGKDYLRTYLNENKHETGS
ncbi:RNA polymerase sigma-70 factor, ECF subfamily [Muriicola jejuensis]|uniref:RNA polymerase sigma factor n=1 Tax=Muriicola jejuensis TaxID=504488 RepID=UPI001EF8A5B8|nr:RNA polymerase sigma factor [Muriicola jejuensis]SMP16313.1 RNA polymerase sigma-70 factor, ECF subfamily [Muriicola jejuensis]